MSDPSKDLPDDDLEDVPGASDPARPRAKKAPNAFRTISEVADELHIPQHVLRFWETKFPQIKPLKRGGGRRYYRPDDILLLRRISDLLYIQGYTIKGVQRLLREGGGALAENIPPATAAERAAAEAEHVEPTDLSQMSDEELEMDTPDASADDVAAQDAAKDAAQSAAREAARLRALMRTVLDELVVLRAMLA